MAEKILLVNEVSEDSDVIVEGIAATSYELLCELNNTSKVFFEFHEKPVVAIYNLKGSFSNYEKFFAEKRLRCPMATVVFVNRAGKEEIEQAVKAGVHALIVNGLQSSRIPAILDTAIYRFEEEQKRELALIKARQSLEDRKVIERAKGILMDVQNMKENDAYTSLRK
ncbi:MAG: ANTAR domain-containing protein, partial [Gammaproteobacteria bacterium]|nr:ANTAR domain-containing protein [Gammaproteobacteria bacterium]